MRKWFFKKAIKKAKSLKNFNQQDLIYHVLPHFLGEIMTKYFRIETIGTENIPKNGAVIIAANHSGYAGFDAFLLSHNIYKAVQRTARVLTHHLWFLTKTTSIPAKKLGFIEAKKENGVDVLDNEKVLLIFPEGEEGNFKPTNQRYHLKPFKDGAIRMALQSGAPIIPTIVIGAEETHINLTTLRFTKFIRGLILPLPLNVIPLPARWKIIFLPPFEIKNASEDFEDKKQARRLSEELRDHIQAHIDSELKDRKWVYL